MSEPSSRLVSLDVFRGATVAGMMLVNNPGSWSHIYPPLRHAEWHGWTYTDTIFPFFLWIVGVAMAFSLARRTENGADRTKLALHVVRRSLIIIAVGVFLHAFPSFDFSTIRLPGVLQRIGICYLFAGVVVIFSGRTIQMAWIGALLSVYWALMLFFPVPGYGAGSLQPIGNFAQYVDSLLLSGHMWSQTKVWDPEGIVSTLPAIATVLFGTMTGHLLRSARSPEAKTALMFVVGNLLLLAGIILDQWLPINKSLWTSSYSMFMAGLALNVFAVCYWMIDIKNWKGWTKPFQIYGMNALTIFFLAGFLTKLSIMIKLTDSEGATLSLRTALYTMLFVPLASPINASLLFALTNVLFFFGIAYVMYRRQWIIKI